MAPAAGQISNAKHFGEARFAGPLSDGAAARAQARARCARVFEPITGRVPLRIRADYQQRRRRLVSGAQDKSSFWGTNVTSALVRPGVHRVRSLADQRG